MRRAGLQGLTACFEALQTPCTAAEDVRGAPAGLELRPGALGAAAALVQRVLAALAAGRRGGTLQHAQSKLICRIFVFHKL